MVHSAGIIKRYRFTYYARIGALFACSIQSNQRFIELTVFWVTVATMSTGEEPATSVSPEAKTTPKRDTWITINTKTKSPVEHSSTARSVSLSSCMYIPIIIIYKQQPQAAELASHSMHICIYCTGWHCNKDPARDKITSTNGKPTKQTHVCINGTHTQA